MRAFPNLPHHRPPESKFAKLDGFQSSEVLAAAMPKPSSCDRVDELKKGEARPESLPNSPTSPSNTDVCEKKDQKPQELKPEEKKEEKKKEEEALAIVVDAMEKEKEEEERRKEEKKDRERPAFRSEADKVSLISNKHDPDR